MPRTSKRNEQVEEIKTNDRFNIIDILKMDHDYVRDCIKVLTDEDEDPKTKLKYAKSFLDSVKKHSAGEKKALYAPLLEVEDFRSQILEAQIEHGIVDQKIKLLQPKIQNVRTLSDELEAEFKVLAELVRHHLDEEEDELFPKMEEKIDSDLLNQMGFQFMLLREFTEKDLEDAPDLMEELEAYQDVPMSPSKLMKETQEYFNTYR